MIFSFRREYTTKLLVFLNFLIQNLGNPAMPNFS